jgi:hypothetical protein
MGAIGKGPSVREANKKGRVALLQTVSEAKAKR